jgi:hypothetical protein
VKFIFLFLGILCLIGAAFAALARTVDPRDDFGAGICPQVTMDSRRDKMRLFKAYVASGGVGGLILGSSRSMKLDPKQLESKLAVRFFNFSVDSGRAEDFLAIYRWVRRQGVTLRVLVLGLDVEALHDDDVSDHRLRENGELLAALGARGGAEGALELVAAAAGKYTGMFTAAYVKDVARSLARCLRPSGNPGAAIESDPDGYLRYVKLERQRATGTFDLDRQIADSLEAYVIRFRDMRGLSPRRQQDLEQLIREAKADGAAVKVWITTLHPTTARYLGARTAYAELLSRTRQYLAHLRDAYAIDVYDYSDPGRYGGSLAGWYDGAHIDETNAGLVAAGLARRGQRGGRQE